MPEEPQFPLSVTPLVEERVLARWMAGRTQSSLRLVGGHLYLTTRRLLFVPNAIERSLVGNAWQGDLTTVVDAGKQKRDLSQLLGGSIRDRLWVEFDDLAIERFRVKHLDEVLAQVRAAAQLP